MSVIEENKLHDYIEKIEKFDKKLSDLDDLMKDIDEELHKKNKVQKSKTTKPLESDDFNILYVHKKIVEAERDRLILKTEFERLLEDKKDFSKRIDKLEENFQELTGGLNQIRLSLSRITTEKSETQKKISNIIWSILVPIIVSFLIFAMSLFLKSCNSTILKDFGGAKHAGGEYINIE
jgi:chromosome segregation ATPase